MFYKLTMKDNRVLFIPLQEVHEKIKLRVAGAGTVMGRLKALQVHYPDCIDWEMVEPEEAPGCMTKEEKQECRLDQLDDEEKEIAIHTGTQKGLTG